MSLFQRIQKTLLGAVQKAANRLTFVSQWAKIAWMDIAFPSVVKNGYKSSSAVFACVRALAFSFPEPPLLVMREKRGAEEPDSLHPLRQLLRRPNPDMGEAEFMAFAVTYAAIGGNCYIYKERNAAGRVVALWPFHDGVFEPVPGMSTLEGIVKEYRYDPGDGVKRSIPKNDIIQWKFMPDPEQPWRGMGAIAAAAKDTDSDIESSRYIYSLLKNDAIPRVVVTLVEGDELTEDKSARLHAQWDDKYAAEKRGGVAFLESGMTIQRLGLDMQELALETLKNIPESRICAAFGVPPVIAGLFVGLKRSDYGDGQARRSFTETTLAALWRQFSSELENGLVDEFGGGVSLAYDLNEVRALQENMSELWTRIDKAVTGGYVSRAEARRALGYDALPADEVYRQDASYQWIPVGELRQEQPALPEPEPEEPESDVSEDEDESEGAKAFAVKALPAEKLPMRVYGRSMQRIRKSVGEQLVRELDRFFTRQSDRVVSRFTRLFGGAISPVAADLVTQRDRLELTKVLRKWYERIVEESWETLNHLVGSGEAFDAAHPAVQAAIAQAAGNAGVIHETTTSALDEVLRYGFEHNWNVDQLVRGADGKPGIRDVVEETYKNRARTIARTELGKAQNIAAIERYASAGVAEVEVLDNGGDDPDEPCMAINGTRQTLEWSKNNPLEHPNCTRCFLPIIEYE